MPSNLLHFAKKRFQKKKSGCSFFISCRYCRNIFSCERKGALGSFQKSQEPTIVPFHFLRLSFCAFWMRPEIVSNFRLDYDWNTIKLFSHNNCRFGPLLWWSSGQRARYLLTIWVRFPSTVYNFSLKLLLKRTKINKARSWLVHF